MFAECNLRHYPRFCLGGLKKTMECLHQDTRCLDRDSNRRPLEDKSEALLFRHLVPFTVLTAKNRSSFCPLLRHGPHHSLTHTQSWALPEKPSIVRPLKNFPAFYGTRRFNTVPTRALNWSLSWATLTQSTPSYSVSLRSILIISFHLRLGHSRGVFPSGVPIEILYAFLFASIRATYPSNLILLDLIMLIVLEEEYKLWNTDHIENKNVGIDIDRQQDDPISVLLFFFCEGSRLTTR
jgi:hypothetical protein